MFTKVYALLSLFSLMFIKKKKDARKIQVFIRFVCLFCFKIGQSSSVSSQLLSPISLPESTNARSLLRNKALPIYTTGLKGVRLTLYLPFSGICTRVREKAFHSTQSHSGGTLECFKKQALTKQVFMHYLYSF